MRIFDFEVRTTGERTRLSASLVWEESERPADRVFFETESRFLEGIEPDVSAILVGTILPAMCLGERRLHVTGSFCPRLADGLRTAMLHFSRWHGFRPLALEASEAPRAAVPVSPSRAASFLSGGVDSLATVRRNRLDFPPDHPASIRDAIFVEGLEATANRALVRRTLERFAERAGLTFIPVATNVNRLDHRQPLQAKVYSGAFFASTAHFLSGRISAALIASSHHVLELEPWGTHPLVDPCYGSAALSILHDGESLWRVEKVALISEWDDALCTLRPCWNPFAPADQLNCGACEKCLRTMTELLIAGKVAKFPGFSPDGSGEDAAVILGRLAGLETRPLRYDARDRDRWMKAACFVMTEGTSTLWQSLVAPLRAMGHDDLARAIERKLEDVMRSNRASVWHRGRRILGRGKRALAAGLNRITRRDALDVTPL